MISIWNQQLWIGNAFDARNTSNLHEHEINTVVDLALEEAPVQPPREVIYLRFPIHDGVGNDTELLRTIVQTLVKLLSSGSARVLVSCSAGLSRSPIVSAAAIASLKNISLRDSLQDIQSNLRTDISPALYADVATIVP